MIIVSVSFVICWFPSNFYFIVVDNTAQTSSDMFSGYYATLFLSHLHYYIHTYIKFITRCIVEDGSNQRRGLLLSGGQTTPLCSSPTCITTPLCSSPTCITTPLYSSHLHYYATLFLSYLHHYATLFLSPALLRHSVPLPPASLRHSIPLTCTTTPHCSSPTSTSA